MALDMGARSSNVPFVVTLQCCRLRRQSTGTVLTSCLAHGGHDVCEFAASFDTVLASSKGRSIPLRSQRFFNALTSPSGGRAFRPRIGCTRRCKLPRGRRTATQLSPAIIDPSRLPSHRFDRDCGRRSTRCSQLPACACVASSAPGLCDHCETGHSTER